MNKIVKTFADALGLVSKAELDAAIKGVPQADRPLQRSSSLIGMPVTPPMKEEEYLNAYQGWVFSCVRVIAEETADIKLQLMRRIDQTQFESVDQHPVLDLLYKVNPIYTSYLLWEATQSYIELTGNAFWLLIGNVKQPREIWLLRPDWMSIKDSKSQLIDGFLYGLPGDGKKMFFPFENVVHFKDFNPKSIYRGMGTVKASAKSIDEDEFQRDYSRQFFSNSALPGGAIKTEQNLTDEQYERIREDWYKVHRGTKKAWQVAILEAGLEWQDIGASRKDMDFIEGRRLTRDEVMAMFRVPKPLLTFDDVNRAAAKEARAILLENVITHKMQRITAFLNEFLLPRYGDDSLFFTFEDPVPNDEMTKLNYYKAALGGAPWLTPNEVREEEEREPVEGGDQLFAPFGLAPIGSLSVAAKAVQAVRKRFGHFKMRIPTYPYQKYQMDVFAKKIESQVAKLLTAIVESRKSQTVIHTQKELPTPNVENVTKEIIDDGTREKRWKTLITRTDDRETRYRHLLAELFSKQKGEVKNRLDQGLSPSEIADTKGDTPTFVATLMKFIASVIETEGILQIQALPEEGTKSIDGAHTKKKNNVFYMQSEEVKKYLKKNGAKFIAAFNEETQSQLQDELAAGVDAGESIPELAARVERVYEAANGYRAERIARSEVLRATNFATDEAYRQSGVVEAKEWLTAHDERLCEWCEPLDGKTIALDDTFFEKGDEVNGNQGHKLAVNIDDVGYPPLHPNCRCTLIPVIKTDDKSIEIPNKKGVQENIDIESKTKLIKELKVKLEETEDDELKSQLSDEILEAEKQVKDARIKLRQEKRKKLYE